MYISGKSHFSIFSNEIKTNVKNICYFIIMHKYQKNSEFKRVFLYIFSLFSHNSILNPLSGVVWGGGGQKKGGVL